ncbi:MAG: hypothetical protein QF464_21215, partial [Myxococcota bacterium]|nr:hypothetical protein [Myxococcota bacterium]
ELQRLLTEGGARRGWVSLMSSGMMPHVLPEPSDLERVRDRLTDERMPPEEAWATVLLEVANPDVVIAAWGQRLRMPKALSRHVSQAVNIAMKLLGYSELTTAQRKRLLRRAESETACRVATRAVAAGQRAGEALETAQADAARWTAAELWPPQLISGDTLVASGHRPGPGFKRALDAVEDAQLEGQVDDEAQALALALATLER